MARVQYSHPQRGINETKDLVPPLKVGDPESWFKAARKKIPQIPHNWFRPQPIVTETTIIFELICRQTHERCAVVIARR